jgi:type III restriction enzyme
MEFKFDANQDFQLEAINAIADIFDGQRRQERDLQFKMGGIPAVANRLDLYKNILLRNLQLVQERNHIRHDPRIEYLTETIATAEGSETVRFPNFSVEMETGTGKTYVYLRTALELYQRYGMRKFIIVVPSVAIREGVLKTLEVTQKHFQALYNNAPYRFYAYNSANLSQIRQFTLSDSVEMMVMTLAAFNSATNVIHQNTDRLQGETPVHLVQAARPILILDEPQNMESEKSIAALAALHPLFALRYSATHRIPYNIVYRLTPAAAYGRRLVKRIEVASTQEEGSVNRPYLRLVSVKTEKRTLTCRIALHQLQKSGQIKEKTLTCKPGDSLKEKSGGRDIYAPYTIADIEIDRDLIRFSNTEELRVGQELGADKAAIFEAQIRYTIEEHLRKQAWMKAQGVKILSLFFIDRVDNYAAADGVIRQLFNQAFNELKHQYSDWKEYEPEVVQAAYFAQKTTRSGEVILEDSKTGTSQKDKEAYELIMKEKERLLSLNEPVSFIFSHSALREGWDNPNVFQICTLNQSQSDVKKRQEIGRGIRLAVDQSGERIQHDAINILTVVANESYESFVSELQSEIAEEYRAEIEQRYGKKIDKLTIAERAKIEEEYGQGILPPKPANARQRVTVKLRKRMVLKPEFQTLWEKISRKTRYSVAIDTDRLIRDVTAELAHVNFRPPQVSITKAKVDLDLAGVFQAWQMSAAKTLVSLVGRYPLPNLVDIMTTLMEQTSPPMRLTRHTLLQIIRCAPNQNAVVENPNEFAAATVSIIKQKLADQLIDGIQYHRLDDWYAMELFDEEVTSWEDLVEPATLALYDQVIVNSNIERQFVKELEQREDVRMYVKLPDWFKIPTPIGNYNPDWAIVMDDPDRPGEELLYLISETKGQTDTSKLQYAHESQKIKCGRTHFEQALQVSYKVMASTADLPVKGLKV